MGGIADFSSRATLAENLMATAGAAPIPGMVSEVRADRGMLPADDVPPETATQHQWSIQQIFLMILGLTVLMGLRLAHRRRRRKT